MISTAMNLATTVIGFGMSATFIVFVCARIICRRVRGVNTEPVFDYQFQPRVIDLEQPEHEHQRMSVVEQVIVTAIPTMRFNREAFGSLEDAQCSICLGEYQENEELRMMPKCGHCFHLACIDVWLRKQPTCPVCRFPVNNPFVGKDLRSSSSTPSEHSRQWLIQVPGRPDSVAGQSQEMTH